MIEKKIKIANDEGVDARVAAVFVNAANQFESTAWLEKANVKVNAKSIMGIISLALTKEDEVVLKVSGEDEQLSVERLVNILSTGNDE